jgi:hypothetical protein
LWVERLLPFTITCLRQCNSVSKQAVLEEGRSRWARPDGNSPIHSRQATPFSTPLTPPIFELLYFVGRVSTLFILRRGGERADAFISLASYSHVTLTTRPPCRFVTVPSPSDARNTADPRVITAPPWTPPLHNMHQLGPRSRRLRRPPMTIASACCRRARRRQTPRIEGRPRENVRATSNLRMTMTAWRPRVK